VGWLGCVWDCWFCEAGVDEVVAELFLLCGPGTAAVAGWEAILVNIVFGSRKCQDNGTRSRESRSRRKQPIE